MILTIQGTSDLFLDLELEVTETAAAGLPLRGSQMDATIRDSDGSGKCDLFLSFSPSVSSEVHARAAYEAKNFIGWARLALTYPPKLQKRPFCPAKQEEPDMTVLNAPGVFIYADYIFHNLVFLSSEPYDSTPKTV